MWKLSFLVELAGLKLRNDGGTREMILPYRRPLIVGHGANNMGKIKRYISEGAHVLEMDVIEDPSTGELVLHHVSEDTVLKSITGGRVHIFFEWLPIPLPIVRPKKLSEVLKFISGKADVMLDLKWKDMAHKLAEVLNEVDFKGVIYVTSRYHKDLIEIKRLVRNVKTLVSIDDQPVRCAEYLTKVGADGTSIRSAFIDKDLVNDLHRHGFIIAAWTVNDGAIARYLRDLGVDMIVTDHPGLIIKEISGEAEELEELERVKLEESLRGNSSVQDTLAGGLDHMFGFSFYHQAIRRKEEKEGLRL